jgi:DNA recombination protein RmuC
MISVIAVLAALGLAALAAAMLLRQLRAQRAASERHAVAAAVAALQAERDGALHTAVETVVALASDKLGERLAAGNQYVELRNDAIAGQLAGMGEELRHLNGLVTTLQKERAEQHGQLVTGLQEHARRSAELAASTQSLRAALSSPKARGQWGERMAEDVLRLAGLAEGVNYRKQTATTSGTIPDFTFLLPGGWRVHMDVKFPIDNYLRLLAADGAERAACITAFLRDVRARVRELSGRGYIEPGVTLDYVLLFIPNEAVYGFIHEHDPAMLDGALAQRVVLCSPFTLFAVLAVIRQAVEQFALERTSDQILAVLRSFSVEWEKFADSLDGLGRKLETTQRAYEELSGPRRRQLQRTLDRADGLAAQSRPGDHAGGGPEPPLRAVGR